MTSPSPADLPDMGSLVPPHLRAQDALPLSGGLATRPKPLGLVASAQRLTSKSVSGGSNRAGKASEWQSDAWDMYDLIGEQRFLANTLAGRASQARLYVGRLPSNDPLAEPEALDDPVLQTMLDSIGKAATGRAQLVLRMVMNYFIAGEGYLVGFPPHILAKARGEASPTPINGNADVLMTDLEWRVLSIDELKYKTEKTIEVSLAETGGGRTEVLIDELYVIRSWRPHPRRAWQADSPTRSSLPVLRELVGLTMAIGAQVDSRLAGAGVFIVPDSARKAMLRAMGESEDSEEDPLADALIEAMSAAISDRSSAASFTPLVLTVPDESADKFKHLTFDKAFDKEMKPLREEAIRRVALGQDAPPELLLGVGGMNHWGAWLVREDVVTTHLEPPLALFCDSVTTQYLRPLMEVLGYSREDIDDTVVWYDVSHMIVRPNRGTDAQAIYDKGELSGEALRRENGFDENDAPPVIGKPDPAVDLALQLVAQAPSLMQAPGLPAIVEQIRAVQSGDTEAAAEIVAEGGTGEEDAATADAEAEAADSSGDADSSSSDGPPATEDAPARPGAITASAVAERRRDGAVTEAAIAGRLEEQTEDGEASE